MGRRANPGKALPTTAGDEHLQSLLLSCGCPIPLHKVRTRFLGSIASPISPSPLETVKGLWGGRLPAVEGIEDRKSTRLNSVTNAHLVCRLLLEKKNNNH